MYRAFIRLVAWTFDLIDADGDPSLSKGIAAGVAVIGLYDAWLRGFTALNVAALALAIAAAFGRSMFMQWLGRWNLTNTTSSSVALTGDAAKVIEAIRARRDDKNGVEPT